MRLAQVGLGSGGGLPGSTATRPTSGQVRVLFFLTRNARQLAQPLIPGRDYDGIRYKKPLCGNPQGKNSEQNLLQTPAPASTLSRRLTRLPPACCCRGQVQKVTSPIHH